MSYQGRQAGTPAATRILAAAADGTGDYPIDPRAAIYRRVPILTTGEYEPSGTDGKLLFDEAFLDALAANYDPFFYAATVNTDHDCYWGPAQGIVLALTSEGGTLYADLAITDYWLADEIDRGMWPARSIEWFDTRFAWPANTQLYDKFDYYLTGLGFLGQREPAVPGLGPVPPREPDQRDQALPDAPTYYALPLAAQSARQHSVLSFAGGARVPHNPEEGEMPGSPTAGAPPDQASELAALKAENEQLKTEAETLKASNQNTLQAQLNAQRDENATLKASIEELQAQNASRAKAEAVNGAIETLKAGRYCTPANEAHLRTALDAVHGNQAATDAIIAAAKAAGPQFPAGPVVKGDVTDELEGKSPEFIAGLAAAAGKSVDQYLADRKAEGGKA